jgi:hypothetical protein
VNLRIVTVTPAQPFDLAPDEQILERTSVYGEGAPAWNLLVAKGFPKKDAGDREGRDLLLADREARSIQREDRMDAQNEQARRAFVAALTAFAAALGDEKTGF